jgi:hypothetical protein
MFARCYLQDNNGRQAAIKAGYAVKGAHVQANYLLNLPKVQAYIEAELTRILAERNITPTRTIQELSFLSFYDPAKVFADDGSVLPMRAIPVETRRAISGFRQRPDGSTEYRFANKPTAALAMSRIAGWVTDANPEADATISLAAAHRIAAAFEEDERNQAATETTAVAVGQELQLNGPVPEPNGELIDPAKLRPEDDDDDDDN